MPFQNPTKQLAPKYWIPLRPVKKGSAQNNAPFQDTEETTHFKVTDNQPEETHGLTTFVADESSKVAQPPIQEDLLDTFKSALRITPQQDIIDFLSRPIVLTDGQLQTTDAATTFSLYNLPDDVIASPMFANKLQGFLGIRATYVITLQVNANRFVKGRYLLNFYPYAGCINIGNAAYQRALWDFSLVQRTTVPGIQIDLNTETQVQLKIPYTSPYLYNPIRSANAFSYVRQIGAIRIHPYVATDTAVNYTLLAHLEDVELFIPTQPQGSRRGFSKSGQEQKAAGIGPVEATAKAISASSDNFKNIPVLGSFVEPVKWAADIGAMIASAFGWSKPTISSNVQVFARHRGYQNVNCDGSDLAVKMALSVKNEVSTIPGLTGTDLDEMSMDYIKSIPAFFRQWNWATTDTKETLLSTVGLYPEGFSLDLVDNGNQTHNYPPCSAFVHNFNKYRGGFKIAFKFVKTEFHSGRLSVVFVPGNTNTLTNPAATYATSYYNNRHVIDIRYGTEWEFEFPYTSEFAYLQTGTPYGYFYVYVENSLQAPSTVAQTINCLMEVSGLPDLEYAEPRTVQFYSYHPTAPQASAGQFNSYKFSSPIGSTKTFECNLDYAKAAIGEKFTSIRQLLKRMELRGRTTATPNVAGLYANVRPFALSFVEGAGTAGAPTYPIVQQDSLAYYSNMFCISRGGIRLKFYDPTPTGQGSCFMYSYIWQSFTIDEVTYGTSDFNSIASPSVSVGGMAAQVPISDGLTAEMQIPMYSGGLGYPIADATYSPNGAKDYQGNFSACPQRAISVTKFTAPATSPNAPFSLRGAADDFSLHGFVCVPPVIVPGTDPYNTNGWL